MIHLDLSLKLVAQEVLMKSTKKFGLVLGLLVLALGAMSCKDKGPDAKIDWVEDKIVSKLDLNKEQEGKLHDLVLAVKEQRKAHKADSESCKTRVKDMILSEKLQKDELKTMFSKKQEQMNTSFDAVYPKLEAFHASLTLDQKKDAVDYLEKISKWHRD